MDKITDYQLAQLDELIKALDTQSVDGSDGGDDVLLIEQTELASKCLTAHQVPPIVHIRNSYT